MIADDAFAFLLTDNTSGQTTNLAVLPNTSDPISVLSVRDNTYLTKSRLLIYRKYKY